MSEEKNKPVLDEQTLATLLEAAFVLQEHNRELRKMELSLDLPREALGEQESSGSISQHDALQASEAGTEPAPRDDYTSTLAQIVETQHQIQVRHLELENAMALVAERVAELGKASGAAIGILEGKKVRYRAAAGLMTLPAGTEVPMEKALSVACLRTGQVIRCADVNSEFLLDAEECLRRGIQSIIAVPIYHDGGMAGGLELYYTNSNAFTEQDVHTCQLMAGLVTEALARDEEVTWKKSLASERAVMLEALEKLKPNLAALMDKPASKDTAATFSCRKCGHELVGEEQFCGKCGTPRSGDYEPPSMQSKVASLWNMQEALKENTAAANGGPARAESTSTERDRPEKPLADSIEEEMPEFFAPPELRIEKMIDSPLLLEAADLGPMPETATPTLEGELKSAEKNEEEAGAVTSLSRREDVAAWTSAAKAKDFLEQLAGTPHPSGLARFWNSRRGDIYLAIAVILVAGVVRWGIWSDHSVSATGGSSTAAHRKPAPDADLSIFDRMLISLGLADAPAAPEYKGNPDTQVWVDLHTALYYCPGADLYGKTPKGKFTTQRDAQLDQFEPALRKACD